MAMDEANILMKEEIVQEIETQNISETQTLTRHETIEVTDPGNYLQVDQLRSQVPPKTGSGDHLEIVAQLT